MGFLKKFLGGSPFTSLLEHTQKVHECVELLRPITIALMEGEFDKLEGLHHQCSQTEHEADMIKDEIRKNVNKIHLLSVGRFELLRFLSFQDDVADAAEDYAVLARIRPTTLPEDMREDYIAFVDQVIRVSEQLLTLAREISVLAESAFTGNEVDKVIEGIHQIGEEEWKADKLERHFAEKCYKREEELGPVTLMFIDKYCRTLGKVANSAEKAAKYLHQIIGTK
ncbi:MAG: TIGR00153 family protein [Candidatus Hydrogenedentota bacterium]